ncbi:hypothetical protein ES703_69604 [subsurface metagenome]
MYDLDLKKVNGSLMKALKLVVATRRLIGKGGDGYENIWEIEREIREAGAECQRVLELVEADGDRPLISGLGG